jgi:hypothetical protein
LIFLNQLYMFRAMFSPIFRGNLTVYTALVQCADLLPTGDTVEIHPLARELYRQILSSHFEETLMMAATGRNV